MAKYLVQIFRRTPDGQLQPVYVDASTGQIVDSPMGGYKILSPDQRRLFKDFEPTAERIREKVKEPIEDRNAFMNISRQPNIQQQMQKEQERQLTFNDFIRSGLSLLSKRKQQPRQIQERPKEISRQPVRGFAELAGQPGVETFRQPQFQQLEIPKPTEPKEPLGQYTPNRDIRRIGFIPDLGSTVRESFNQGFYNFQQRKNRN